MAAYRRLLGNGPLSRLLLGEFISLVGDRTYLVALLVLLYRESHDATVVAVVGAIRLVPYLLLSIPAGFTADRFDRRYVLIVSDIGRGICMLILAALVVTGGSVLAIAATAFVAGSFSPLFHPALRALIPSLVRDESEYGPANSAWGTLDSLSMVVGPVLAGVVIGLASVEIAFALNAATFALDVVILLSIPATRARASIAAPGGAAATAVVPDESTGPGPGPGPGPRRRLRDVVNLPAVSGLMIQVVLTDMAFGALDVVAVILAIDTFRGGEAAAGYLTAAIGVGGVIGSLVAGVLILQRRLRPVVVVAAASFAASLILLGLAPDLAVAFLAMALVAAANLVIDIVRMTIFQLIVPDAYRGRFGGLMMTTAVAGEALGVLLVPILAATLGLAFVMNLLAAGVLATTALALALLGTATNQGDGESRTPEGANSIGKPA
ncbi:MAG: MFS transporter [Chloroflexota bacterium]